MLGEGRGQAAHQPFLHHGCREIAKGDAGDPQAPCPFTITEEGLVLRTRWLPAGQLWGPKGASLGSQHLQGGAWPFPWKCQAWP